MLGHCSSWGHYAYYAVPGNSGSINAFYNQLTRHLEYGHPLRGRDEAAGMEDRYGRDDGITFHSFRHTFATRCAAAGVPLRTLQEWLGHRDYKTVLIYADYQPDDRREAGRVVNQASTSPPLPFPSHGWTGSRLEPAPGPVPPSARKVSKPFRRQARSSAPT